MQAWKGWTATTGAPTTAAPTWVEWCTRHHGTLRNAQLRQHGVPFSEQELARLSFVRWLYKGGRLDPREHDTA